MKSLFSSILVDWYQNNLRNLPWRNTKNPFFIWLSEVILQQTRVSQGLPYYEKFIEKFPTVYDLANAEEQEVLKLWQGLGYYSRARNLHTAAKYVVNELNGDFPTKYNDLIQLKGVGTYTASAIASFSSNEAVAVLDGNVYRVLARNFGIHTPINSTEGQKQFKKLAFELLDPKNAAEHNQAIMEFGALNCTPKKPNCLFCPFQNNCVAFQTNTIEELPVKLKKTKVKEKHFYYLILKLQENKIVIQKRTKKGIWQHLYQFPLLEKSKTINENEIFEGFEQLLGLSLEKGNIKLIKQNHKPHKLSHQHIFASFYELSLDKIIAFEDYEIIEIEEFDTFPIPVLISNFVKDYNLK